MEKVELKVTMEPERLDAPRKKNSSVGWMSCMKNMCRQTPAPIWITSISRLRRGPDLGVQSKAVRRLRLDIHRPRSWNLGMSSNNRTCEGCV